MRGEVCSRTISLERPFPCPAQLVPPLLSPAQQIAQDNATTAAIQKGEYKTRSRIQRRKLARVYVRKCVYVRACVCVCVCVCVFMCVCVYTAVCEVPYYQLSQVLTTYHQWATSRRQQLGNTQERLHQRIDEAQTRAHNTATHVKRYVNDATNIQRYGMHACHV